MYIIVGNENFQNGVPIATSKTKKEAEDFIKSLGFTRKDNLWVNSTGDDGGWLRINPINLLGEDNEDIEQFIKYLTT
jgi:hypothetical protein